MSSVEFTSHRGEVMDATEHAVRKALQEIGIEAENHAKTIAEEKGIKDTGLLVNSITWAIGGEKPNITDYAGDKKSKYHPNDPIPQGDPYNGTAPKRDMPCVYIGSNVKYADAVENGTSKKKARPYLKPAVEDFRNEYKEIVEDNLKNG